MIDRSRIGFTTPPTTVAVDAWRVKLTATLDRVEAEAARYALRGCTAAGSEIVTGTARVGA